MRSKVFNERGALILPCRITPRIMPGVVDIPQGAWYEPDEKGDRSRRLCQRADLAALDTICPCFHPAYDYGTGREGRVGVTAQYAFLLDARFCSGCKACQAACKDKNNLPPGVLWRRVIGGIRRDMAGGWRGLEQLSLRLQSFDRLQSLSPSQSVSGSAPRMRFTSARMALLFWMNRNAWAVDTVPGPVPTVRRNTMRMPVA